MTQALHPDALPPGASLVAAVQARLLRDGFAIVHSPALCDALRAEPARALHDLVGQAPVRHACVDVAPVAGRLSIVESDRDGRLHVDAFPFVSPDVVVMSCDLQAEQGGETQLVDTWPLVGALAARSPRVCAALFLRYREFRFPAYHVHAPTFSLRNGRLTCHHATFPQPGDDLGERFQSAVDAAPRIEFRLGAGDLYLIDNHRMLHGRTRFHGPRRLQRLQAWLPRPAPAPAHLLEAAALARRWHDQQAAGLAPELRQRLGLAPLADPLLARIPKRDLDAALSAFVAALPAPPGTLVDAVLAAADAGVAA